MGLFQSLSVGVSGLTVQSHVIDLISDNIANVNTNGYKKTVALFHDLIAGDSAAFYSPGGALAGTRYLNRNQGPITITNSATDIAMSGNGFFTVRQNSPTTAGNLLYTRAGSFLSDENGDFKNGAGFFLQGWRLVDQVLPGGLSTDTVDASTAIASLETVNIGTLDNAFVATTNVAFHGDLRASQPVYVGPPAYDATDPAANMADGGIPPHFSRSFTVIDSNGDAHSLVIGFLKSAPNIWEVEVYAPTAAEIGTASAQVAAGTMTFNGDGTLASTSPSLDTASVTWQLPTPPGGTATNALTFNWGTAGAILGTVGAAVIGLADGIAQFDEAFIMSENQNGFESGTLTNVVFTEDGFVVANYSNGTSQRLYQIPLANFTEPNALLTVSGNAFNSTDSAGTITFSTPNHGASGKMLVDALESSNVELESQMVDMIIAQRAYQTNAKTITTADDMLARLDEMMG